MPRHVPLGLALAALMVSLPAIAGTGDLPVAGLLPWLSGGLSLAALLGLAVQWGMTRQQQAEHERRICAVEDCASTTPHRLAHLTGVIEARGQRDDERHSEVLSRLDRIETRQSAR